jgi:hypothetical protein
MLVLDGADDPEPIGGPSSHWAEVIMQEAAGKGRPAGLDRVERIMQLHVSGIFALFHMFEMLSRNKTSRNR